MENVGNAATGSVQTDQDQESDAAAECHYGYLSDPDYDPLKLLLQDIESLGEL